jgi:hypothetical protein
MKALVCPNTTFEIGGLTMFRVAEVNENGFDVAEPLFWVECPENCIADEWYYDPAEGTCLPKPEPEPAEEPQAAPTTPVEVLP